MKVKLRYSKEICNPYSGIYFVSQELNKQKIPALIDNYLPERAKQSQYKYSDILLSLIYGNFCGLKRLEDLNTMNLKKYLNSIPSLNAPSPDRVSHLLKQLSTKTQRVVSPRLKKYEDNEINNNSFLINLMHKIIIKLKLLRKNVDYTLDIDTSIIATEKYDARNTYDSKVGYNPCFAFIGDIPVNIEGRNGNTNPKYKILEFIKQTIKILNTNGIKVKRVRIDSAGFSREVMNGLNDLGLIFLIRQRNIKEIPDGADESEWISKIHRIKSKTVRLKLVNFWGFRDSYGKLRPGETGHFKTLIGNELINGKSCTRLIITNDLTLTDLEIYHTYNRRGEIERNFDRLKNDFNVGRIPFSFLNYNTSFIITSCISLILNEYILRKFSKKISFIKGTFRIKAFIESLIKFSCKIIDNGGNIEMEYLGGEDLIFQDNWKELTRLE